MLIRHVIGHSTHKKLSENNHNIYERRKKKFDQHHHFFNPTLLAANQSPTAKMGRVRTKVSRIFSWKRGIGKFGKWKLTRVIFRRELDREEVRQGHH